LRHSIGSELSVRGPFLLSLIDCRLLWCRHCVFAPEAFA
jgi:hypothetical protein